jgi:hypothetical protein
MRKTSIISVGGVEAKLRRPNAPASAYISPPASPSLHGCVHWCAVSSLLLGQGGHEFAAEVGDIGDHPAPDQVTLAERRLVHPGRAGVLQVVFDP